jgi:hypothetical protein
MMPNLMADDSQISSGQKSAVKAQAAAAPGDPYCGNCGYLLKGLEDSTRCPECGKPIIEVLMRKEFSVARGKRYRSKANLFGLPVIDVAYGPYGNEKRGRARGIIAIGDFPMGVLAIGGLPRGIVAIGGVAVGCFAIGGNSIGLITSLGGNSVGGLAVGGTAWGVFAIGAVAFGVVAEAITPVGVYVRSFLRPLRHVPPVFNNLRWLLGAPRGLGFATPLLYVLGLPLLLGAGIWWMVQNVRSKESEST